jgi:hypothetical protein
MALSQLRCDQLERRVETKPPIPLAYATPEDTRGSQTLTLLAWLCAGGTPIVWATLAWLHDIDGLNPMIAVRLIVLAAFTSIAGIIFGVLGCRRRRKNYPAALAFGVNLICMLLNCAGLAHPV